MKTPKKSAKTPKYTVTFTMGDLLYKGVGNTPLEALQAVPRPPKISGKGYLQLTDGEQTRNLPLNVMRAKQFFRPSAQPILVKYLSLGMK